MTRVDYYHDPSAPKPNSLKPAAAVAVLDSQGNLLMVRRRDNDKWSMPGGTMQVTESLCDCAIREVKEETGLDIAVQGLVGTYTDPEIIIAYADGEVRREFAVLYIASIKRGNLRIDLESSDAGWFLPAIALELPMARSQRTRIQDVVNYLQNGVTRLR